MIRTYSLLALNLYLMSSPAAAMPFCDVIGGGNGHLSVHNDVPTHYQTARTFAELKGFLQAGEPNVFIPADVDIRLPLEPAALVIGEGQRVFGDRGIRGSVGARLYVVASDEQPHAYPVITLASFSRVSGLRLEGPSGRADTPLMTIGLQLLPGSRGVRIDNNDIYHWPWAGISVKQAVDNTISYNYIHHNLRHERGYGMVVQNGHAQADLYCNVFDANRHALAGSGQAGEGYYAHHNLILQGGGRAAYHQMDMHKLGDIGGKYVDIRYNWFDYGRYGTSNRSSIMIRGIPTDGPAHIAWNIFSQGVQVGSQWAIDGVPGAIPGQAQWRSENTFDVALDYVKTTDRCELHDGQGHHPVLCEALDF